MADLFARIKPKKSSTPGEVPLAADLEVSELAVNTADGKLFTKHTDNTIKTIGGGGGVTSIVAGTNVTIDPVGGTGDVTINAVGGASNIVDQGDYSPRYDLQAPTWTANTSATGGAQLAAGECAITTPFYVYLELRTVDSNGVDRSAQLAGLVQGNVLTFTYNNGASSVQKTIETELTNNGTYWTFRVNNSSEPWTNGESVQITGGTLTSDPLELPKATGDLVTWNGVTSKFEPTPLNAISKATLQAEVAASTDFADFQARIAAL